VGLFRKGEMADTSQARVDAIAVQLLTADIVKQSLGDALNALHDYYQNIYLQATPAGAANADIPLPSSGMMGIVPPTLPDVKQPLELNETQKAAIEYLDGIRIRAEADYATVNEYGTFDPKQIAFDIASIEVATGVVNGVLTKNIIDDIKGVATETVRALKPDWPKLPWWSALILLAFVLAALGYAIRAVK
jgi:hypothetical protein